MRDFKVLKGWLTCWNERLEIEIIQNELNFFGAFSLFVTCMGSGEKSIMMVPEACEMNCKTTCDRIRIAIFSMLMKIDRIVASCPFKG